MSDVGRGPSRGGHEDAERIRRAREGDERALDELVRKYHRSVYNLAYRLAGNREEAADLTQEIFLRVFRHLGSFGGRSTLKTWIFRIAINHCRDRLSRWHPLTQPIGELVEGYARGRFRDYRELTR